MAYFGFIAYKQHHLLLVCGFYEPLQDMRSSITRYTFNSSNPKSQIPLTSNHLSEYQPLNNKSPRSPRKQKPSCAAII